MRTFRTALAVLAALCLLLSLVPAAFAAGDERFDNKSWEEITTAFLQSYGATQTGHVAIGYYNTVTGEEQYYNPDDYITVGSVYKVPLNMVYCERIANGEMTLESPVYSISYQILLRGTIIDSNNDYAKVLWDFLGGYHNYRRTIAPYMGEDPDTVIWTFYENNLFTARQMTTCLRLLYENPERFPYLLDTMKEAEPNNYFRRDEQRYTIAHKYGYNVENYHTYIADAGVVYTEEPFLLVMFTDNSPSAYELLAQYAVLMSDYTEYQRVSRLKSGASERAVASLALPEAPSPVAGGAVVSQGDTPVLNMDLSTFAKLAGILAATLFGLGLCAKLARRAGGLMLLPAAVILAAGLLMSVGLIRTSGVEFFTVSRDAGREAADAFFTALEDGEFKAAAELLAGYTALGPEAVPADAEGQRLNALLRASYSHALGSGKTDGSEAVQNVSFTHLSYSKLGEALREETRRRLDSFESERSEDALYDGSWNFRPEVVEEARSTALEALLLSPADWYVEENLTLGLHYSFSGWQIGKNEALVNAICGK